MRRTRSSTAELRAAELRCPGCGHRYDAIRAGRCIDDRDVHLEPVPLLVDDVRAREGRAHDARPRDAMTGGADTVAGSRLGRLARRAAAERVAVQERCDLCSAPIPDEHRHLLDLSTRASCGARAAPCSLLFDREAAARDHYRLIPDRRLRLDGLRARRRAVGRAPHPGGHGLLLQRLAAPGGSSPSTRARWARRSRCSSCAPGRSCGAANPVLGELTAGRRGAAREPRARRARPLARADRRVLLAGGADQDELAGVHRRPGGLGQARRNSSRSSTAVRKPAARNGNRKDS